MEDRISQKAADPVSIHISVGIRWDQKIQDHKERRATPSFQAKQP
ncbi:hypothetical protein WDW89_00165 [Deltaproteobacteria bacterium TL4]